MSDVSDQFEHVLDRRLSDFEKVMDARLSNIQDGVTKMQNTMTVIIDKFSNQHIEYVPRTEIEKDQERSDKRIEELEKKVEKLQAWRNYLAGAMAFLVAVVGILVQGHFWK